MAKRKRTDLNDFENLTPKQKEPCGKEQAVDKDEHDNREKYLPRGNRDRDGVLRFQQVIDNPRLPTNFCRNPTELVDNERQRNGPKRQFQKEPILEELSSPRLFRHPY